MRRHIEGELHDLEAYAENHKKEIEAGDHHDPNYLEHRFCDRKTHQNLILFTSALTYECLIYDDNTQNQNTVEYNNLYKNLITGCESTFNHRTL